MWLVAMDMWLWLHKCMQYNGSLVTKWFSFLPEVMYRHHISHYSCLCCCTMTFNTLLYYHQLAGFFIVITIAWLIAGYCLTNHFVSWQSLKCNICDQVCKTSLIFIKYTISYYTTYPFSVYAIQTFSFMRFLN